MSYTSNFVIVIFYVLAALTLAGYTVTAEGETTHEVIPNCRGLLNKIIKEHLQIFSSCIKELRASVGDNNATAVKMNCAVRCTLEKSGLLDGNEKVTKQTLQGYMDRRVPELYHEIGHSIVEHCFTEFGPEADLKDEYCAVYGKYVGCLQEVVTEIC